MGAAAQGSSVGFIVSAIVAVFLLLFLLLLHFIHVDEIAEGVHVHCSDLLLFLLGLAPKGFPYSSFLKEKTFRGFQYFQLPIEYDIIIKI